MSDQNKKIMAQNIKRFMEKKGVTNQQLCDDLGFKYTTFMDWIKAVTYPRIGKVEAMANYFGCEKSDLIEDKSGASTLPFNTIPLPRTYNVPLVGNIACGQPILAVEDADEVVSVPEDIQADFALRCQGDSMITARIFDGDVVYIKQQPEVEPGQIAAVRIGDEATLKRVYYSQDDSRVTLRACNPLYPDQVYEGDKLDEIEILGLAVGFFSRVLHE